MLNLMPRQLASECECECKYTQKKMEGIYKKYVCNKSLNWPRIGNNMAMAKDVYAHAAKL